MNKTEFWLMNNPVRRLSLRFEANKLKKMSGTSNTAHVLEIGCGEGQGSKNILRLFNPTQLDAIDLDPLMIDRAKRRVKDARLDFRIGDASDLSFASDHNYDAVFDFGIIHHIPNWQDCIKEVHRVLKPGGLFILEDLSIESFTKGIIGKSLKRILDHPYNSMYKLKAFETELASTGFKTVDQASHFSFVFWKVARKV